MLDRHLLILDFEVELCKFDLVGEGDLEKNRKCCSETIDLSAHEN